VEIRQGIDIVGVQEIEKAVRLRGSRYLTQTFTPSERAYCDGKRMRYEHYAARLAAKRAVLKVLLSRKKEKIPMAWIEIGRLSTGKPEVWLSDALKKKLQIPVLTRIEVSIAHERKFAIATVLLMLPKRK